MILLMGGSVFLEIVRHISSWRDLVLPSSFLDRIFYSLIFVSQMDKKNHRYTCRGVNSLQNFYELSIYTLYFNLILTAAWVVCLCGRVFFPWREWVLVLISTRFFG